MEILTKSTMVHGEHGDQSHVPPGIRHQHAVVLLDKPLGMSSQAAVLGVRKALGASKAGHTGTLDPLATGLLPVALGEATKFTQGLLDADKVYEVTVRLGARSVSGDQEGPIEILMSAEDVVARVSDQAIADALQAMTGCIQQLPPQHAAIKVQGRPLYEYARAGEYVSVPTRTVHIWACDLLEHQGADMRLRVHCSKGTYIRSLARDLGESLGVGGYVLALRRTQVGPLKIDDAFSWGAWDQAQRLPVDALCMDCPAVSLSQVLAARFQQGQRLSMEARLVPEQVLVQDVLVRVYADVAQVEDICWPMPDGRFDPEQVQFLGLASLKASQRGDDWRVIAPQRLCCY